MNSGPHARLLDNGSTLSFLPRPVWCLPPYLLAHTASPESQMCRTHTVCIETCILLLKGSGWLNKGAPPARDPSCDSDQLRADREDPVFRGKGKGLRGLPKLHSSLAQRLSGSDMTDEGVAKQCLASVALPHRYSVSFRGERGATGNHEGTGKFYDRAQ